MAKLKTPATGHSQVTHKAELRQVIGKYRDASGRVRRIGWDMDVLILDGKQISTINRVPGSVIFLMDGFLLTPGERKAIEDEVAKARGGVKPRDIKAPLAVPYQLLDDEDTDEDDDE